MADQYPDGKRTGMINYQNFLKRFLDLGFNNADCINELIDNAIDAGAQNIEIELVKKVEAEKENHYLQIVDNGTGMDELSFVKFFEMFGDKQDAKLNTLGKKGIGGKVALVTLSKLDDTMVVSKTKQTELMYTKISWSKLREAGNICINEAGKKVEKLWEETQLVSGGHGTIAIINLSSLTYNELENIMSSDEINERNVYYTVCRNYFRHLQNGTNITFTTRVNEEVIATLKCVPLDPLHFQYIDNPIYKGADTLRIYKNSSANGRIEVLVKKDDVWIGFVQNKRPGNKMIIWNKTDIENEKMRLVGEVRLEHSYIMFEHEKDDSSDDALSQKLKEKHILEKLFPRAKVITKDNIMLLTCGTHLERNQKETGLLLHAQMKKAGDYDRREFYNQSRHRLIFECTSSNDDLIDAVFQTQINKSKVDANELPEILTKTIKKLNEEFALKVFDKVTQISTKESPLIQVEEVETKQQTTSQIIVKNTSAINPKSQKEYVKRAETVESFASINDAKKNTKSIDVVTEHLWLNSGPLGRELVEGETAVKCVLDNTYDDGTLMRESLQTTTDINNLDTDEIEKSQSFKADHDNAHGKAHDICENGLLNQLLRFHQLFVTMDIKDIETLCSSICSEEQSIFCEHLETLLKKLNVKI
jgi:hypothetical protein